MAFNNKQHSFFKYIKSVIEYLDGSHLHIGLETSRRTAYLSFLLMSYWYRHQCFYILPSDIQIIANVYTGLSILIN